MSGGSCVAIISESLKLKAPSPDLEKCLRATLQNPLVVERLGPDSDVWQLGVKPQWDKDDQKQVQQILRDIIEADMPHIDLPPAP